MADAKIKISALIAGTPLNTDIIPYVDLVTNTTKKALKSELKGDKGDTGDNATVDAGTTTTLIAGESATVTNVGTTSDAIFNFAIPQGIQGLTGDDGACVESVAFVGNDMVFTLDDASTVTLTNAKVTLKGDTGDTGAKITSAEFVSDDLVFTLDDASTVTITGAKTALKGDKGDTGDAGIDWQGAWSAGTYTVTQAVSHNGSSWIATTTTTEEPSILATDWDLIALKGTDGAGSGDISGSGTANELAYFTAEKTIDNLAVATYPSLTELSYVKGVTSAIQTQLNGKQASGSYEVTTNKENTTLDTSTTKYPTNRLTKEYADGKVADAINDGTTTIAPSQNAVFDALALKASLASPSFTTPTIGGVEIPSISSTSTLTNKRITQRVISATSYTTNTGTSLDVSTCDQFEITAQAGALLFNAPGGTPLGGQKLIIRIKDNGTARALTYNAIFRAMGNALPSTTVLSKTLYMGFIFNATDTKWDLVAVAQEA